MLRQYQELIESCFFFKNRHIIAKSLYKEPAIEKCFLAEDLKTKEKFKVRIAHRQFPNNELNEYRTISFLRSRGIRWVPNVLYRSDSQLDKVVVYEYFNGETLDKITDLSDIKINLIKDKLIEQIAQMHSFKSDNYGDFVNGRSDSWVEFFEGKLFHHAINAKKLGVLSSSEYEVLRDIFLKNVANFLIEKGHLLHFDIKAGNIVYDEKKRSINLIDFELSRFGDSDMEFSRFLTYYNTTRPLVKINSLASNLYSKLFLPLAQHFIPSTINEFIESKKFLFYHLHNLLAGYTIGYLKHGVNRQYMLNPIKNVIDKLKVAS